MTQALARAEPLEPIPILDKYAHGVAIRPSTPPWLATISAGTKDPKGYPRASRESDARWIHIAPGDAVPGLEAALEAGHWRELTIALPSNDHRDFLSQRFVRYSASRLEAFGDAQAIHVLSSRKVQRNQSTVDEALPRQTFEHGTPEYDREVDQCAVAGSLLFVLGWWREGTPEIYFPDDLGLYRLRFTSRTSLQRLVGGIEHLRGVTGGSVAGVPLRLSLQFGEVADAGGIKRTVPFWSVRFTPPPGVKELTATSWSGFKAAAFAEVDTLRGLPPGAAAAVTAELAEAEGPDADMDNPQPDAETIAARSAQYERIFGHDDDVVQVGSRTVDRSTGEVLEEKNNKHASAQDPTAPEPSGDAGGGAPASPQLVNRYRRNRELVARARELDLAGFEPLALGKAKDVVEAANLELEDRIARHEWEQAEVARQKAQEGLR